MNIECILKREGGTRVTIETTDYHFKPQTDGAHVADVEIDEHIQRFLGIHEAYKIYRGASQPPAEVKQTVATAPIATAPVAPFEMLVGSSVHDATFDINGKTCSLGDVVALAHIASGLTVAEWNGLPDEDRHSAIDAELDKLAAGEAEGQGQGDSDTADERAALMQQYEAKFGKKAHPNTGIEKLRAALAAE